jgi:hypothetical protein
MANISSCQFARYSSPELPILHVANLEISQVADFGLAACIDPTNYAHFSRCRGTPGHYAPVCIRAFNSSYSMATDRTHRSNSLEDGHTGTLRDVATLTYGERI